MLKYILLFALSFPVQAHQTKQEIIDYCTRVMLKDGGNQLVLLCIKQEMDSLKEIKSLESSK